MQSYRVSSLTFSLFNKSHVFPQLYKTWFLLRSVLQSDGTYVTSSYIHLTASRWDHGQEVRCEASNEVSGQEAEVTLAVR